MLKNVEKKGGDKTQGRFWCKRAIVKNNLLGSFPGKVGDLFLSMRNLVFIGGGKNMKIFFGRYIFVIVLLISGFLGVSIAQEDVDLPAQDNIDFSQNTDDTEAVIGEKTLSIASETDPAERNEFYKTIEKYSPVKVYIERVEAVVDSRNFAKVWSLTADSLQQKLYGGSFENFIKFPERMVMAPGLYFIRSVEFRSPERVRITFDLDVIMVKEDGEWKFGGDYQEPEDTK